MTRTVLTAGTRHSALLGIGGYRPRRVVGNAEICRLIDSTEEWIETRSGIVERRFADHDETLLMMAATAAEKALAQAGTTPAEVDLVLVASMSNLVQTLRSPCAWHTSWARAPPRASICPPPAPASAMRWPWPPTRSARAAPAGFWSSAPNV